MCRIVLGQKKAQMADSAVPFSANGGKTRTHPSCCHLLAKCGIKLSSKSNISAQKIKRTLILG